MKIETNSLCLRLQLKSLPTIDTHVWNALIKRLLSVSIRSHIKNNHSRFWSVEIIFFETPLKSKHHREQGQRRPIYFQYEMGTAETVDQTIDNLLNDWSKIVYLYYLVHDFSENIKNGEKNTPKLLYILNIL